MGKDRHGGPSLSELEIFAEEDIIPVLNDTSILSIGKEHQVLPQLGADS